MSRYIDYDAIDYRNDKMHDKSSDFIDGVIYMAQRIEDAPSIDIDTPEVCYMCRFNIVHFCAMTEADKSSERDRSMRHRQFDDDDDVYKGIPKWCPLKGERKESE